MLRIKISRVFMIISYLTVILHTFASLFTPINFNLGLIIISLVVLVLSSVYEVRAILKEIKNENI